MPYPPTGSTYYPTFSVEGYYDSFNNYRKRFMLMVYNNGARESAPTYNMMLECFDIIDGNLNGFVSLSEFRTWMAVGRVGGTSPSVSTAEIDSIFALLDAGDPQAGNYGANDGKLSFEETQYMYGVWITFN